MNVRKLMQVAPVIPVLVIDDVAKAKPLAQALVNGGLKVLEVTLRTPQALEAMQAMSDVEGAIVGVGTALNGDDLKRAQDHGATFAVSPGFTPELGKAANAIDMPLLPGIMTPADIMRARDERVKIFPGIPSWGAVVIKRLCRSVYRHRVLSDRWHQYQERARVFVPAKRTLCWWQLGSAERLGRQWQLGSHYTACPGVPGPKKLEIRAHCQVSITA